MDTSLTYKGVESCRKSCPHAHSVEGAKERWEFRGWLKRERSPPHFRSMTSLEFSTTDNWLFLIEFLQRSRIVQLCRSADKHTISTN
ncbi:hypothetical protein J437_LFUL000789 [Ladona fulva]|uniref:Uncharacterized protein n=1 Tax=Ladona fulva TaxID=123851 RepID=A0A8K0KTS3_LADFU|nr:hypothetical protein J437_LFUL000789 [Ladona fulva]